MSSSSRLGADDFAYEEPTERPSRWYRPPPRELRRLMKDWRAGRATTNVCAGMPRRVRRWSLLRLMIGAMVVNVILKAQTAMAQCTSVTCLSARAMLPWAAFALAVAAALAASRLFGPVLASAAEGFWLLDTPVSRAKLLGLGWSLR